MLAATPISAHFVESLHLAPEIEVSPKFWGGAGHSRDEYEYTRTRSGSGPTRMVAQLARQHSLLEPLFGMFSMRLPEYSRPRDPGRPTYRRTRARKRGNRKLESAGRARAPHTFGYEACKSTRSYIYIYKNDTDTQTRTNRAQTTPRDTRYAVSISSPGLAPVVRLSPGLRPLDEFDTARALSGTRYGHRRSQHAGAAALDTKSDAIDRDHDRTGREARLGPARCTSESVTAPWRAQRSAQRSTPRSPSHDCDVRRSDSTSERSAQRSTPSR